MNIYNVIKKPLITEKATGQAEKANQYTFEVVREATKIDVRRAIEAVFKVDVLDVRTVTVHGKPKRNPRARSKTRTANWKKSVVTLKKGDKIDFASGA